MNLPVAVDPEPDELHVDGSMAVISCTSSATTHFDDCDIDGDEDNPCNDREGAIDV